MKIKYCPQIRDNEPDTIIQKVDSNTLNINGEDYYFPPEIVVYDIPDDIGRLILDAHREDGELFIKMITVIKLGDPIWTDKDWNGTGNFRGTDYEDI